MTATAIELTARPPGTETMAGSPAPLAPDAVAYVADTDTLLTGCSCAASEDQAY